MQNSLVKKNHIFSFIFIGWYKRGKKHHLYHMDQNKLIPTISSIFINPRYLQFHGLILVYGVQHHFQQYSVDFMNYPVTITN
jgi:hypothetical protein